MFLLSNFFLTILLKEKEYIYRHIEFFFVATMDSLHRLQEQEGYPRHNSTSSNGEPRLSYGSPGRGSAGGLANSFLVDSLRRSVDMPAYMQWQTLSTDVSLKLR